MTASAPLTFNCELLTFENHLGQRLGRCVRDAQRNVLHAELSRNFSRLAVKRQSRPPAGFPHDFQICPTNAAPPARPQRLHRRLLRRESPRVALVFVFELFAVFALLFRIYAPEKNLTVALDGALYAVHLGNVHAHSDDQDASAAGKFGTAAGSDYTGMVVALAKALKRKGAARRPRGTKTRASNWGERRVRGVRILEVSAFVKFPWLVHGFSTRPGGISDLDGEKVLNLGFTEWDSRENVMENRRRLQSARGANDFELAALKQFHSDIVHEIEGRPQEPCCGDASITNRKGVLLGVQTADCVPILLVDPKNRAVAAVHAGWRGTLQRIGSKTLGKMQMRFGTKPSDVLAAIGPAIGGCCYEVGTEVAVQFKSQFPNAHEWFDELRTGDEPNPLQWLSMMPPGHQPPPKNVLLDLKKANQTQLLDAGVRAESIFVSALCTACRRDLLFSYRKEGAATGRLMAVIGVRSI